MTELGAILSRAKNWTFMFLLSPFHTRILNDL